MKRYMTRYTALALPLLILTACDTPSGGSEDETVSRLASQGFLLVSDGRGNSAETAMRYAGAPSAVIECRRGSGPFRPTDQARDIVADAGLRGRQTGSVDAYVIIANDGRTRGVYANHILREIRSSGGRVVGREVERVTFSPGGRATFRNGLTCRARS